MSNLTPLPMSYGELADVLDDIAAHVRAGDSFEGNLEYLMPEPEDGRPDGSVPDVMVRGVYRVGNLAGQGGMRMVGVPPS